MKLSIVTTLYKSAPYIEEFFQRIKNAAEKITQEVEFLFVNDGSPDNSLEIVAGLQKTDSRIVTVNLARNFGHHHAIMAGLGQAVGDFVFLIDCDLEESPELIFEFWNKMKQDDSVDVVYGVQEKRKGYFFERASGALAYSIINKLSDVPVTPNILICRLMKREYVDNLLLYKDKKLSLINVFCASGYNQVPCFVTKKHKKSTTYSLGLKLNLFFNSLTNFTSKPLFFIFYLGLVISFFSFLFCCFILMRGAIFGHPVQGWLSLICALCFFGGVIILCQGIIGIYLSIIYSETKDRPNFVIKSLNRMRE